MKKLFSFSILGVSLITFLNSCSSNLHGVSVNVSNGGTSYLGKDDNPVKNQHTFNYNGDQTQYIMKGRPFKLHLTEISQNDSIIVHVTEQDIRISGDDANKFVDSLRKYTQLNPTSPQETETLDKQKQKIEEKLLQPMVRDDNALTKKLNNERDSIILKAHLNYINETLNELIYISQSLTNEGLRKEFLDTLDGRRKNLIDLEKKLDLNGTGNTELHIKIDKAMRMFYTIRLTTLKMQYEKINDIFPSKEEITISIKKYNRSNRTSSPEDIFNMTFIQLKRFKIFSSVGAHCMIYNGKYAGIYDNKDSLIVRRNGSNIIPSLGTYLNGTWRLNDCLMGIGLGMGIPLQLTDKVDMTPNFNILWTTNFQNQYGRFGINMGFGIQKVNVLSPGFNEGDNLGTSNLDVPLKAIWTPTFGVGISYNIGERE
jgi:hypothetical protein